MENTKDTNKVSKILIIQNGKVLLVLDKRLNKYTCVGGHLEHGESFIQGMKREVKEETGLDISWFKVIYKNHRFCLFKGGVYSGRVILSDEHTGYAWVDIFDANKLNLCNYTKRDIMGLQNHYRKVALRKQMIQDEIENYNRVQDEIRIANFKK